MCVKPWRSCARDDACGTSTTAYAFTLPRWGGFTGIDPASLPAYRAYSGRVMQAGPVAAALERERVKLDTYKPAA